MAKRRWPDVTRLLDGATPTLMMTDPPYGVEYDPAWRHRRYATQRTAVGRVAHDDRVDWTAAYDLFGGAVTYVWHAGLFAAEVAASLQHAGFALRGQSFGAKRSRSARRVSLQHEPCGMR